MIDFLEDVRSMVELLHVLQPVLAHTHRELGGGGVLVALVHTEEGDERVFDQFFNVSEIESQQRGFVGMFSAQDDWSRFVKGVKDGARLSHERVKPVAITAPVAMPCDDVTREKQVGCERCFEVFSREETRRLNVFAEEGVVERTVAGEREEVGEDLVFNEELDGIALFVKSAQNDSRLTSTILCFRNIFVLCSQTMGVTSLIGEGKSLRNNEDTYQSKALSIDRRCLLVLPLKTVHLSATLTNFELLSNI